MLAKVKWLQLECKYLRIWEPYFDICYFLGSTIKFNWKESKFGELQYGSSAVV